MTFLVNVCTNLLDTANDSLILDRNAVYLNSLVKPDEVRRRKETSSKAGEPANRLGHRANGSFSICAGDMNELQLVLRISHVG
jgi:hypothetical protein